MDITYSSTRRDQWRCNLYVLLHRPQTGLGLLVVLVIAAVCHAWLARSSSEILGWETIFAFVVSLLGGLLVHALILHAEIVKRLPAPTSKRICTTSITPEFFRDVMPEKTQDYRWADITSIRLHRGDFYFWIGGTKGNFIPHSAFDDRRDAQQFFDLAQSYWQAAKSGVPTGDEVVWPPPPRSGASPL